MPNALSFATAPFSRHEKSSICVYEDSIQDRSGLCVETATVDRLMGKEEGEDGWIQPMPRGEEMV